MSDSDRIDRTHIMDSRVPPRQPFIRINASERLTTCGEPNGRPLPRPYVWHGDTAEAEQARAEADAAFIADARRRARERFEAGLPPEFDVKFSETLPGPAGARVTTASESSGAVMPTAETDESLYPLEMARAAVGRAGEPRPAWCTACRHHYRASNPQCTCACHLDSPRLMTAGTGLPAGAGDTTPPVTTAPCPAAPAAAATASTADKGDSWPAEVPGPVPAVTGTGDAGPGTGRCDFCGYMRGSRGHEITCGGA